MYVRDYRDIIGGVLLIVLGIAFSGYAWSNYRLGTLAQMGPGMFPMALGVILAFLGTVMTVPAVFRPGELPKPDVLTASLILIGVIAFALTIRPLGLIPAICILVVISSLAELKLRIISTLALCVFLSVMAWLIFGVGLGLPISMFPWR